MGPWPVWWLRLFPLENVSSQHYVFSSKAQYLLPAVASSTWDLTPPVPSIIVITILLLSYSFTTELLLAKKTVPEVCYYYYDCYSLSTGRRNHELPCG